MFVYAFILCRVGTILIVVCPSQSSVNRLRFCFIWFVWHWWVSWLRLLHLTKMFTFIFITFMYKLEHISWCNLSVAHACIVNGSFAQIYIFWMNVQSNVKFTWMSNLRWKLHHVLSLILSFFSFILGEVQVLWKWFLIHWMIGLLYVLNRWPPIYLSSFWLFRRSLFRWSLIYSINTVDCLYFCLCFI